MEKELNEVVLEEGLNNETVETNHKFSKVKVLGIVAMASATALLLKFRKKINTKIENRMVKKLTKKGYIISNPTELEIMADDIIDALS